MHAIIEMNKRRFFRLMVIEALSALHYGRAVRLTRSGKASGMWNAVNYMMGQGMDAKAAAKTLAETPIEAFEPVEGGAR